MSFAEWTATSIDPSRSASSISFTNTPRSPIWPNGLVRSRSPTVVIGTSAISIPGPRSRSAASSAWVSASLLPRLPIVSSTLPLPEPEEVPSNVDVPGSLGGRRLLQAHDRDMQELVHDLGRQRFDGAPLALGETAETGLGLRELSCADGLGSPAERCDRRDNLERGLPGPEPLGLVRDDRLGARSLAPPAAEALADDRLEVVDVVQVAAVDSGHGGIDVTRNGEVDDEQRAALAVGDLFHRQDVSRSAGRGDDDVDARELLAQLVEGNCAPAEPACELIGSALCPARHGRDRSAALGQAPRGELAHLPRSDKQHLAPFQVAEHLLRECRRGRGDRGRALADRSLCAHLLPRVQSLPEETIEHRAAGAGFVGRPHLAENLPLPGDQRIEPGRDAEEVQRGRLVAEPVELDAVAGREADGLAPVGQPAGKLSRGPEIECDLLAHSHRREPVRGADDDDVHAKWLVGSPRWRAITRAKPIRAMYAARRPRQPAP